MQRKGNVSCCISVLSLFVLFLTLETSALLLSVRSKSLPAWRVADVADGFRLLTSLAARIRAQSLRRPWLLASRLRR